jgi:Domain of Unknown Function (DUF1080)
MLRTSSLRFMSPRIFALGVSLTFLKCNIPARGQNASPSPHAPSRFVEPQALPFSDHTGFEQIFDGKSLADWEGDPSVWRVVDGAIVGESTKEKPVFNTYIWRKGLIVKDFDLKLEIKCEVGGGSGIQYRSQTGVPWLRPLHFDEKPRILNWMMTGPQADIWFPVNPQAAEYTGQFYSENTPLGILAWRGEAVETGANLPPTLVGTLGNRDALGGYVKINDWNQFQIIARGGVLIHILNGHLMAILIDDDPASSNNQPGKIGIELESTPAKVSVRNIWIRKLP